MEKRPEDLTEEDVTDETLRKEMDENLSEEELGGDSKESSTDEKPSSETSTEDEKPVTDKVEKEESESVPYNRFKEVNEKANKYQQQLERLERQYPDRVKRNADGDLELVEKEERKQVQEPDPDELTDEDKLYFDEAQLKVIEKIAAKRERMAIHRINSERQYWSESESYFNKAKEKFPDLVKKDSEMWKRADKIIKDRYTQWSPDKKTYYVPPNAQWLAALEANEEIRSEKEKVEKTKKEELTNKKQNTLVETKSKKSPSKKDRIDSEDFDSLSREEQDAQMFEEFDKATETA